MALVLFFDKTLLNEVFPSGEAPDVMCNRFKRYVLTVCKETPIACPYDSGYPDMWNRTGIFPVGNKFLRSVCR